MVMKRLLLAVLSVLLLQSAACSKKEEGESVSATTTDTTSALSFGNPKVDESAKAQNNLTLPPGLGNATQPNTLALPQKRSLKKGKAHHKKNKKHRKGKHRSRRRH